MLAAKEELRNSNARRAEQLLKMAAEKIPNLASACNDDGIAVRAKGQLVPAVVSFRCALLLNPEMAQAHLNLGLTYRSLGQVELALRYAADVLQLGAVDAAGIRHRCAVVRPLRRPAQLRMRQVSGAQLRDLG